MRVIVLHNPTAGDKDLPREVLLAALRAAGHDTVYHSMRDESAPDWLQEAGDVLLAAGGDGTVRRVALELATAHTPIGILPLGTANNVAHALGIPDDPHEVIRGLAAARQVAFDVGIAHCGLGENRFIEGLGFGLFAEMMAVAKDHAGEVARTLGARAEIERDLRMLKALLPLHHAVEARVEANGEIIEDALLLLEVLNIATIGPNLRLAPEAEPDDGALNIVVATEAQRPQLAAYFEDRLAGATDAVPDLRRLRADHVRIEWTSALVHLDDQRWAQPDDERAAHERHVFEIAVERHARCFLAPARP